jgi:hemerythrin-like domain-containing protein
LRVLSTVAADAAGGPIDAATRHALEGALRYFAIAAPKHTADEETSLFPRLRESTDPAVKEALASLDKLEHDHDEAETHHGAVDELVRRWLAADRLDPADLDDLRQRLTRLEALYQEHIEIEDHQIFPAAARALDRGQIDRIGSEMAARRNVSPSRARR